MTKLKIKAGAILNENKPEFFAELMSKGVDAVEPEMKKQLAEIKTEKDIEKELVRKLKDSFPDMLDFNNCLKELRKFWKEQQNKEFIELIKNIKNPYLEDIFPKLTQLELDKINALLESVLKFPLDRLSADLMRRARNNLQEELKSSLIGEENGTK